MLGPLIGPTLGGWLVEYLSWHWIFWINFVITVIATLYFGWHYVADDIAGVAQLLTLSEEAATRLVMTLDA